MATAFIDDTGNSKEEPVMYMGGWVGRAEDWDSFTDEWASVRDASNPKPIAYFKHSEARSLSGCFAVFEECHAAEKMLRLAEVIARHDIYGAVFMEERAHYNRLVEEHALIIRGRTSRLVTNPAFSCMNALMCYILGKEYRVRPNDKVDFVFDGKPGTGEASLITGMFENNRDYFMPEPFRSIMGTTVPMDDKRVPPLQAADFLVGQVRAAVLNGGTDPDPLVVMRQHRPIEAMKVPEEDIVNNIKTNNVAISTRRLSTIKRELDREKKN